MTAHDFLNCENVGGHRPPSCTLSNRCSAYLSCRHRSKNSSLL